MIGFASHALGRIGYGGGYMIELTWEFFFDRVSISGKGKDKSNEVTFNFSTDR